MAHKDPVKAKAYRNQYDREYRALRRSLHLCVECGTKDEYTLSGNRYCENCQERHTKAYQKYAREHREERSQYYKARREQRIQDGRCTQCGKPAWNGHKLCMGCTVESRLRSREKRRRSGKLVRALYAEFGLCPVCGRPRSNKMNSHGKQTKLCDKCYENACRNIKKARDAYLVKYGETWGRMIYKREVKRSKAKEGQKNT